MGEMSTLTRADLADSLNRHVGLSRAEAAALVESILDHMSDALERGEFKLGVVDTLMNWADLGTKAHGAEDHDRLTRACGLIDVDDKVVVSPRRRRRRRRC